MVKNLTKNALAGMLFLATVGSAFAQVVPMSHSTTPTLVNVNTTDFPNVNTYTLIGSDDTLANTPTYRFGGSADGAGLLLNGDGTFTLLVNHEDNYGVSRIILDNTFTPVSGEWLVNSNAGRWRLCSATMATPAIHGFGPTFLTCGESSIESMTHAIDPYSLTLYTDSTSTVASLAVGIGKWNAENAVPLPWNTFGKTVVIVGDDDSGNNGGQVVLYVADNAGDLNNGDVYVLRRRDLNQEEMNMAVGTGYPVEFVQINNQASLTGAQLDAESNNLSAIKFGRVEDLDYRKGSDAAAREIFFTVTGQNNTGNNANYVRTKWGRVYKLVLNANNPLKGFLTPILGGDDKQSSNPAFEFMNPDNICATKDYVYVQEDPNAYSGGNSSNANYQYENHDARIYQYDLINKSFKIFMELDHHRSALDSAYYNRNSAGNAYQKSINGSWEYGAFIDISEETAVDNLFLLSIQPHTWRGPLYQGIDGGTLRPNENQASSLLLVENVPTVNCGGSSAAPSALNVTNTTSTTADLTWSSNGMVTPDSFIVRVASATNPTLYTYYYVAGAVNNTLTISNLVPCETYTWQVRNRCAGYNFGWATAPMHTFNSGNTPVACVTVWNTQVVVSNCSTATINWTPCASADSFRLRIKPAVGPVMYATVVNGNSITLNNLMTGSYMVRIQSWCNNQMVTTGNITVNMPSCREAGNAVANVSALTVSPNPTNGPVAVEYFAVESVNYEITVLELTGREIKMMDGSFNTGSNKVIVDLSDLTYGSYLIQVKAGEEVTTTKVVVNN